jgi:hypothetical protein
MLEAMAAYTDSVKIASIHFAPLKASRNYRSKPYEIPAVPLDEKPKILTIFPLIQRDEGPVLQGPGGGRRQKLQYPVTALEIAHCLVGEWTGGTVAALGMNPQCHPGVWVVRERVPVVEKTQKIVDEELMTFEERMVIDAQGNQMFRDATPEEREAMWQEDLIANRAADRAYAEYCWNQGNHITSVKKNGSREPVPQVIPPTYKMGAKQYGLQADWLAEAAASDSLVCQNCGEPGSRTNFMCKKCGEPTDIERWASWKARKDAALKAAEANLAGPTKGGKQPLAPPIAAPPQAAA